MSGLGLVSVGRNLWSVVVGIGERTASVRGPLGRGGPLVSLWGPVGRGGLLRSAVDLSVWATFVGKGGIAESVVDPCCFGMVRSVKAGFGGIMTSVLGKVLRESGAAVLISVIIIGGGSRSDFVLLSLPASIKQVSRLSLPPNRLKQCTNCYQILWIGLMALWEQILQVDGTFDWFIRQCLFRSMKWPRSTLKSRKITTKKAFVYCFENFGQNASGQTIFARYQKQS